MRPWTLTLPAASVEEARHPGPIHDLAPVPHPWTGRDTVAAILLAATVVVLLAGLRSLIL